MIQAPISLFLQEYLEVAKKFGLDPVSLAIGSAFFLSLSPLCVDMLVNLFVIVDRQVKGLPTKCLVKYGSISKFFF